MCEDFPSANLRAVTRLGNKWQPDNASGLEENARASPTSTRLRLSYEKQDALRAKAKNNKSKY